VVSFPNAKINLGLNIIEKRKDGYHDIESCFYPIAWEDALEIIEAPKTQFKSTGIAIPGEANTNLCLKAYNLLKADFELPNFAFHLHKAIPIGAGLGGGSADGAFTLKLVNQYCNLNLTDKQLESYARQLGADCAFFIENKPKYCFAKGDEFEQIKIDISGKYIVLVNPNIHISTAEAYSGVVPKQAHKNIREIINQPINTWKGNLYNDFETSLFPKYGLLPKIKTELYQLGANYASMTGSGATIYGLFDKEINLDSFAEFTVFQKLIK
jgi:4-diphosphocytidyl-2-C-methyl-D-erythritol kinase